MLTIGLAFWILMLVWLAFGLWSQGGGWFGGSAFQFILFFLLGWKVFGFPIHG